MKKFFKRNKQPNKSKGAEDTQDRSTVDQPDSSFNQNSINCTSEDSHHGVSPQSGPQTLDRASLCELLGVSQSESGRGSANVSEETLIQESVRSHLPQPPKDLDTDLQRHLLAVQTVMRRELIRLAPWFDHELMRVLTQSYHRAVFRQMKELLLQTSSSNTSSCNTSPSSTSSSNTSPSGTSSCGPCLQLLHRAQYLSQGLFLHPDLQTLNLLKHVDLVLLSSWFQDAQDKLLRLHQTDVSSQLNELLERERQHQPCHDEEDYVSAYVDVIQCIDALPKKTFKFSPELSLNLTQVCVKELLLFMQSYKTQWLLWLEMLKKKKMADREMLQFFRTMKICKELKKYISETRLKWTEVGDITEEIETLLEETEVFTLTVLLDTVAVFTESGLKKYFGSNHRNSFLMNKLEPLFRPEPWMKEKLKEHKRTMDICYWIIVSLYSKHLTRCRLHKLEPSWSPDVANSVSADAELIHEIMTNLCPGVEEWNFILHFISDLLKTKDINAIKISAGEMLRKCKEKGVTEGASLLPALLQWKGLHKREIKEVLDSLDDVREARPAPRSVLDQIRHWIQTAFCQENTNRNTI